MINFDKNQIQLSQRGAFHVGQCVGTNDWRWGAAAGALIVPSQEVQAGPSYEASYVGDKLKSSG